MFTNYRCIVQVFTNYRCIVQVFTNYHCIVQVFTNYRCYVSGWGKDTFGDKGNYQHLLKEVDLPVLDHLTCQNQLRRTRLGPDFNLHPGIWADIGQCLKKVTHTIGGYRILSVLER